MISPNFFHTFSCSNIWFTTRHLPLWLARDIYHTQQSKEGILNLFGHICREGIRRMKVFKEMEGKTTRGRPHKEWLDDINGRCIEGLAPTYLRELCCSTVTIQHRVSLRTSAQAQLRVPGRRLLSDSATPFGGWSNGLEHISVALHLFFSSLKTTLFDRGWAGSGPQ